ncbi:MAG: hypothetical protein CSB33_01085 [Desulfobacterales bacterium]|nr:MAG: hypothetical protein CSB33_01085 [Desulfobacterales bacterium]
MRNIGTRFVGERSFRIVILGIAKFAENVVIGENGIVTIVISALMVLVCHVSIVVSQAYIQILNKSAPQTIVYCQAGCHFSPPVYLCLYT